MLLRNDGGSVVDSMLDRLSIDALKMTSMSALLFVLV